MDSVYAGACGRLKALTKDFLSKAELDDLEKKGKDDFLPALSNTPYKSEISALYNQYPAPELIEAAVNSKMMKRMKEATQLLPTGSKPILKAYLNKWDIENIRLILYSKIKNFEISGTDAFLVIDRTLPVSTYSGFITKEDYANMMALGSLEDVIEAASKYWYGTKLMSAINSMKSLTDIDTALRNVEIAYYENLLDSFKFYNGDEGPLYRFFKELIDIRNITTAMRFRENQMEGDLALAEGGNLKQESINAILSSPATEWKTRVPYDISEAVKIYQESRLLSFIGTSMMAGLYKRYLPVFKSNTLSLSYIFYFIIRAEIERKELLALAFKSYNNISDEKAKLIRITSYMDL